MAQHYQTKNFTQKKFREIENGIQSDFERSRGLMKTSMRYDYINTHNNVDIYLTTRTIPNGLVVGTNRGTFEVHYNKETKQITHIYLVA